MTGALTHLRAGDLAQSPNSFGDQPSRRTRCAFSSGTDLWGLREEHLGSDESRRYELSWAAFNFYAQLEEEARAEQYRAGFDPSWGDGVE